MILSKQKMLWLSEDKNPPNEPHQSKNHSQKFQVLMKVAEKPRVGGWVGHTVQVCGESKTLLQRLGVNKASPSFLGSFLGGFFFGMRLQNTFLLGHVSSAKHIVSIPWSGSQDNIKPVNCSNCHKGRAGAAVESFGGDTHHMDHFLLDSSSWSHQTSNHPREPVLQLKPLRNLPANLHGIINACPSSELLTH